MKLQEFHTIVDSQRIPECRNATERCVTSDSRASARLRRFVTFRSRSQCHNCSVIHECRNTTCEPTLLNNSTVSAVFVAPPEQFLPCEARCVRVRGRYTSLFGRLTLQWRGRASRAASQKCAAVVFGVEKPTANHATFAQNIWREQPPPPSRQIFSPCSVFPRGAEWIAAPRARKERRKTAIWPRRSIPIPAPIALICCPARSSFVPHDHVISLSRAIQSRNPAPINTGVNAKSGTS